MRRLHRAWEVRIPPDGAGVLLSDLASGRLLRLNGDRERWVRLCEVLRRGADDRAVERELRTWPDGAAARRALAHLEREGVLIEGPEPGEPEGLFDRQIRFFDLFETNGQSGHTLNENLQGSRVVLVGLGGYGVWLATVLHRMGVGEVIGVDDDRVETTNLHRQFLYGSGDVGRYKADVCAERLGSFSGAGRFVPITERVTDAAWFAELADGASLVINAFGYGLPGEVHEHPRTFHVIAEGCERARVPSLTFGGSWHGPLRLPGTHDACAGCVTRVEPFRSRLTHHARPVLRSPAPSMPARLGLNACLAAWEAVRFLSGMGSRLRSAVLVLDTFGYTNFRLVPLEPSPECGVCHDYRSAA